MNERERGRTAACKQMCDSWTRPTDSRSMLTPSYSLPHTHFLSHSPPNRSACTGATPTCRRIRAFTVALTGCSRTRASSLFTTSISKRCRFAKYSHRVALAFYPCALSEPVMFSRQGSKHRKAHMRQARSIPPPVRPPRPIFARSVREWVGGLWWDGQFFACQVCAQVIPPLICKPFAPFLRPPHRSRQPANADPLISLLE
jgi:hypothetical protein